MALKRFDTYYFESIATENGTRTWSEDGLMNALGYDDRNGFRKAMLRAMQACLTLSVDPSLDFIRVGDTYKFTRFACFLIAMNGDVRKPNVAMAQAYFAALANSSYSYGEHADIVDRVVIREEMTEGLKTLADTAKQHGVNNYAQFMNAGYRGMYNGLGVKQIEHLKGVGTGEHLIDRMGRTELAANLFRVTLTDNKIHNDDVQIHNDDVRGQSALETAAFNVGQVVRKAVIDAGGSKPEDLPLAMHIKDAKKLLKKTGKRMKELSSPEESDELSQAPMTVGSSSGSRLT